MIKKIGFNTLDYSNHNILFSNVLFAFVLNTYMYSYFFKPLNGIVRVLPLFLRSNLNRDISLFLHNNWNSDISIEKSDVKVVILTSGLLDLFPVFELFIQTSKNLTAIENNINLSLWGDMRDLDADMRVIINRLREMSDPHIKQTLLDMQAQINMFKAGRDSLPYVNGLPSYSFKFLDFYICTIRVEYLGYLVEYMSQQDVQTFEVAKDTFVHIRSDFYQSYRDKVEASQILSKLNYSKLMMEVQGLLKNNPFDP